MINIDNVYQRVLFLANKEQRGYITPDEFNSFAAQAQIEIFESYFLKAFQTGQAPGSTEDYANPGEIVDEKISYFDVFASVAKTTTNLDGGKPGYAYPEGFYRLDHVSVDSGERINPTSPTDLSRFPIMADEISHRDSHYVNLSPLTRPTITQPVYIREEGGVVLFPQSYDGDINMLYVRRPVDPNWGFLSDPMMNDGMPVYNMATSTNFELHPSEEHELVYRILYLAGVTIKQQDLVQFGASKTSEVTSTEA